MPKLKIISTLRYNDEICDLEQAKDILFRSSGILTHVVVEGQLIQSYEDLVQLISQEQYKDREFLEVRELPIMPGGG
ncbi:hypothetical protein ACFLU8_00395 [Chloroflexota bacterium]